MSKEFTSSLPDSDFSKFTYPDFDSFSIPDFASYADQKLHDFYDKERNRVYVEASIDLSMESAITHVEGLKLINEKRKKHKNLGFYWTLLHVFNRDDLDAYIYIREVDKDGPVSFYKPDTAFKYNATKIIKYMIDVLKFEYSVQQMIQYLCGKETQSMLDYFMVEKCFPFTDDQLLLINNAKLS